MMGIKYILGKIKDSLYETGEFVDTSTANGFQDGHDKAKKRVIDIIDKIKDYFGDCVDDFVIKDISEDLNHITYSISFHAYESFSVSMHCSAENYSCYIMMGGVKFMFQNVQKYFEIGDYETLFSEIKQELELRLPDKFLKARGWLSSYDITDLVEE